MVDNINNIIGKTIDGVIQLKNDVAVITLDDGTTLEVHHIKMETKTTRHIRLSNEISKLQEEINIKTFEKNTLIPVINNPMENPAIDPPIDSKTVK